MARNVTVQFEDGTSHTYQNVPDGASPDMVESRASMEFKKRVTHLEAVKPEAAASPEVPKPRKTQAQEEAAIDRYERNERYKKAMNIPVLGPLVRGVLDVSEGVTQPIANLLGGGEEANAQIAQREQEYQQSRGEDTGTFDPLRMTGNIAATLPAICRGWNVCKGAKCRAGSFTSSQDHPRHD
jgi:hypothetical protein